MAYHYTEDLGLGHMPAYRLLVFVNQFAMNDDKRRNVKKYLEANPCSVLWVYAPGIINPDRVGGAFDIAHLSDLCGFGAAMEKKCAESICRITGEGAERLPGLRRDLDYGWFDRFSVGTIVAHQPQGQAECSLLAPYIYGDDDAEVLMRFAADGRPAMLTKRVQNCDSYIKALSADIYRAIAQSANCHIYSESDDVLYMSDRFVTIHASSSGEKIIQLPHAASPYEIYERKSYGESTRTITCSLRTGETRTFHLKGEI